jgi:hypothetical protein
MSKQQVNLAASHLQIWIHDEIGKSSASSQRHPALERFPAASQKGMIEPYAPSIR